MAGLLRLTVKEANGLADVIELNEGNADSLRAAANGVSNPGNHQASIPASGMSNEEYLEEKRSQSHIEHGVDLECTICRDKFDHLISDTCEVCFQEWMLSTRPKDWVKQIKKFV